MSTSDEYLAKLGFDSSDMEGSLQKLITLTGHLSASFPDLEKNLSKVERTLLGTSRATQQQSKASREVTSDLEKASKQTALYNQYLYDQERGQRRAADAAVAGLSRTRYAIYDVSNAALIGGAALTGMAVLGAKSAIDMQRDFAQVVRTTEAAGSSIGRLRAEFKSLYTSLPTSYGALTEVGSLGGQLDIPISRLREFTKITTQFAATTDVAMDAAGTAFGRLDQLLPDVEGNYRGLADSILKVGVNSVATESQIISITSQIAPLAKVANLSSKEVIGLAGTLASLGVAPENARGNVTRLFGLIDSAVAGGGSRLDDFAKLSGRTSKQFAEDWRTAGKSQGALLDLFTGINAQGRATTAVLQDIGITATRDQVTFSKLAQNVGLYANQVENAAKAGGTLEDQYSVIASTVSAKLQILGNNFNQLVATVSDSALSIGLLIDPLIMLLQFLDRLASNPAAATVAALGLAFMAASGIALLITSAMGRLVGNYYAGVTAAYQMTGTTNLLTAAQRILSRQVDLTAISLTGEATAARAAAQAQTQLTGATTATNGAQAAAVGWGQRLRGILGRAGLVGSILLLVPAVFELGNALADWGTDGEQAAKGLNKSTEEYVDLLKNGGAQEAIANLVANSAELGSVGKDGFVRFLRDVTFSAGGLRVVEEQFSALDSAITELAQTDAVKAQEELSKLSTELEKAGIDSEEFEHYFSQSTAALKDGTLAAEQAVIAQQDLSAEIRDTIDANTEYISSFLGVQRALRSLGEGFGSGGFDLSGITEGGISNLENLLRVVDAIAAQTPGDASTIAANLDSLYKTLERAGAPTRSLQFLRDTIQQLTVNTGGQLGVATVQFDSFYGGMASGAEKAAKATKETAKQVRTLVDYANDLGGVLTRAFNIRFGGAQGQDQIASGWNKIRDGIAGARDEIDRYTSGIGDAQQELVDLNVRMQEYQATLSGIASDRAVNEYWLRIANRFGNTLRAGQISADIDKNDADAAGVRNSMQKAEQDRVKSLKQIADLNKQIADAQDRANFALTGNTNAAIANRAAVLGMLGDYNAYIQALAASGIDSQTLQAISSQLRGEFAQQAAQAGVSAAEIDFYSQSFNDMSTAISNVPADVTVDANVDPALQALEEFRARYYQNKNDIEANDIQIGTQVQIPDIAGAIGMAARDASQKLSAASGRSDWRGGGGGSFQKTGLEWLEPFVKGIPLVGAWASIGGSNLGWWESGTAWTGSGPRNQVSGVVHNQEAVLNARATSMVPASWINSLNQGRMPAMQTVTIQGGGGGNGSVMELGSRTLRELSDILQAMRTIIGDDQLAQMVDRSHSSTRSVGG